MKALYIRVAALICVRDFVEKCGGNFHSLCEEVGIDPDLELLDDKFCSLHRIMALYEIAAQTLQRPNFGLELALDMPPDFAHFSPFVYLAHFEKTTRSWFWSARKFQAMFSNGHRPQLIEFPDGDLAAIRLQTDIRLAAPRQWLESQMAVVKLLVDEVVKSPQAKPNLTRMRHAEPDDTTLHKQIFDSQLEFGAQHDELIFDRKHLDIKLKGGARFLRPLIGLYLSRRMRHRPQLDLSTSGSVRLYLQCLMGMGRSSLEDSAEALGLTPKKLQRSLQDEGTNFSDILEDLRRTRALNLLRTREVKVKHVAAMLDYSATASFSLAFKRWTGMSPEAYRKLVRKNGEEYTL